MTHHEAIERRKVFVTSEIQKIKQQFANVSAIFVHNEASMVQTQELGECLYAIYNDGTDFSYLFEKVKDDMVANQKIIEKNRKILSNLSN
jgi:hypothetical protein